jgi:hypothetical protein
VAGRNENNHPTKSIPIPGFGLKRITTLSLILGFTHHNMAAVQIAGGGSTNSAFRVRKFVFSTLLV